MDDAGFLSWIRNDLRKKVILAEIKFGYESGGVMTEGTVYLANHPYISAPTDTVPNRAYRDVISRVGQFGSSIDVETLGSQSRFELGTLELAAGDGTLDFLLRLVCDGREVSFWVGDKDWPRGWFRRFLVGVVKRVYAPDESRIVVEIGDRRILMDAVIVGATISGSGSLSPMIYGNNVKNHAPVMVDATTNKYLVLGNYSATSAIDDVRDAGVSLGSTDPAVNPARFSGTNAVITANAGTETITYTGHGLVANDVVKITTDGTVFAGLTAGARYWVISAGLTANDFRLSATRGGSAVDITGTSFSGTMAVYRFRYMDTLSVDGKIQLSASPAGQITVDMSKASGVPLGPFELSKSLIETWAPTAAIDSASFAAAASALSNRITSTYNDCHLVVADRLNLLEALDAILLPFGGWVAVDYDGFVRAGLMNPANIASQTATRTLSDDEVDGQLSLENLPVAFGGASVQSRRNCVVQTDGLATSLGEADRARYSRQFQYTYQGKGATFEVPSSSYAGSWWAHHDGGKIARIFPSQLYTDSPLNDITLAIVEDQKAFHQLARARVGLSAWDWKLGEVVELTYPRFGLSAGKKFRLAGKVVDLDAQTIELTLLTQTTPDYTTSEYA